MSPTYFVFLILLPLALSHSQLTDPRPAATQTCPLPRQGALGCPGPCDTRFPLTAVTATFERDEVIEIKYQRNNHPPGGFLRITIVPEDDMLDKAVHDRNAFHFSCWGAETQVATAADFTAVQGVSLVGVDNGQGVPEAFYVTRVRIPTVIRDGEYVLGWTWYGGTMGGQKENTNPSTVPPGQDGFFSDYWTCSKVRVSGGPTTTSYTPVFINDMPQFSADGCMSSVNDLDICTVEPCSESGSFRRPRQFLAGDPSPITPDMFGPDSTPPATAAPTTVAPATVAPATAAPATAAPATAPPATAPPATAAPATAAPATAAPATAAPATAPPATAPPAGASINFTTEMRFGACACLIRGTRCSEARASDSGGVCLAGVAADAQSAECRNACCFLCESNEFNSLCTFIDSRNIC